MYYIFYTLAILEKFFTGLKTTASQWTMSGQDDHLSGQTISWPVIFYRMAAQFNMSFRSGLFHLISTTPSLPPPPPHSRDFLRGPLKVISEGGWLCQHLWSLENFWRVCSPKCHTSPPPNPCGKSQGKVPRERGWGAGERDFLAPSPSPGVRGWRQMTFQTNGYEKKWAISEGVYCVSTFLLRSIINLLCL